MKNERKPRRAATSWPAEPCLSHLSEEDMDARSGRLTRQERKFGRLRHEADRGTAPGRLARPVRKFGRL